MIADRPALLLADPAYTDRPGFPYRIDWTPVPDLVRRSIADLGGIQPVTKRMFEAAGGPLHDIPSEGEVDLFRRAGTEFQLIWIIVSLVTKPGEPGAFGTTPFALSLMPARKRDAIQTAGIDLVAKLETGVDPANPHVFSQFDPFDGSCGLFGMSTPGLVEGPGYLDEIGLVIGSYWLAIGVDDDEILAPDIGLPEGDGWRRYAKYRRKLLFNVFRELQPRRVWGADSAIELFLIQELARRGYHPQLQMLIMENGGTYPSFYNLWSDIDFRWSRAAVTEADLFFAEERVAVFCDGGKYHRGKRAKKDEEIAERLRQFGIEPVRIDGAMIVRDLTQAADLVEAALASRR